MLGTYFTLLYRLAISRRFIDRLQPCDLAHRRLPLLPNIDIYYVLGLDYSLLNVLYSILCLLSKGWPQN